jgi:hypothetical protein
MIELLTSVRGVNVSVESGDEAAGNHVSNARGSSSGPEIDLNLAATLDNFTKEDREVRKSQERKSRGRRSLEGNLNYMGGIHVLGEAEHVRKGRRDRLHANDCALVTGSGNAKNAKIQNRISVGIKCLNLAKARKGDSKVGSEIFTNYETFMGISHFVFS